MPKFVMKLDDIKLKETGAINEEATSNVVIVNIMYPNYSQSEFVATLKAPLKENKALKTDTTWKKNLSKNPTHNWLFKGKLEGEGAIKVQVINAKKPSLADKIASNIIKSAIDSAISMVPASTLIKGGLSEGVDNLDFDPAERQFVVAECLVRFECNDQTGEILFFDGEGERTEQFDLKAPSKISVPQRKTHRGAFDGWENIVLIEKGEHNGYVKFDFKHHA